MSWKKKNLKWKINLKKINVNRNNIKMRKKWQLLFQFTKEKKLVPNWKKYHYELEWRISENLIQIIIFYLNFKIIKINNIWEIWGKMLDD